MRSEKRKKSVGQPRKVKKDIMRKRRRRKIAIRKNAINIMNPCGSYETALKLETGEIFIIKDSFENLIRELNSPMSVLAFIIRDQIIEEPQEAEEGDKNV